MARNPMRRNGHEPYMVLVVLIYDSCSLALPSLERGFAEMRLTCLC